MLLSHVCLSEIPISFLWQVKERRMFRQTEVSTEDSYNNLVVMFPRTSLVAWGLRVRFLLERSQGRQHWF